MSSPSRCSGAQKLALLPGLQQPSQAPSGSLGMYPLLDLSLGPGSAPLQSRTCALSGVFPCACRLCNLCLSSPQSTWPKLPQPGNQGQPFCCSFAPFQTKQEEKKPNNNKIETKPRRKKIGFVICQAKKQAKLVAVCSASIQTANPFLVFWLRCARFIFLPEVRPGFINSPLTLLSEETGCKHLSQSGSGFCTSSPFRVWITLS